MTKKERVPDWFTEGLKDAEKQGFVKIKYNREDPDNPLLYPDLEKIKKYFEERGLIVDGVAIEDQKKD